MEISRIRWGVEKIGKSNEFWANLGGHNEESQRSYKIWISFEIRKYVPNSMQPISIKFCK
jgi:hypothetical protein